MAGLYSVPSLGSYFLAFGETTDPTILVSDKLKNDPVAMKIIAEMEAQKERL